MLILILIDVQYSLNAVFSFKMLESSKSLLLRFSLSGKVVHPLPPSQQNFQSSPHLLILFGKPCIGTLEGNSLFSRWFTVSKSYDNLS